MSVVRNSGLSPEIFDPDIETPLRHFLINCYDEIRRNESGAVANYIPELSKANPAHFGAALATIDGHVYEIGDSDVEFTIQSVSKAFVFSLALEMLGGDRVESHIGVEPSGEAFNSIRLNDNNRPFNPMVNAGAIACSGLIYQRAGENAFDLILETLGRFAGRKLPVHDQVYASERATGDRNRAIAWMLRNYEVIGSDVDGTLDVYFRQCSVLVSARDLAVMAATLANNGINPLTRVRVVSPYSVSRTLSVMTSSGMYDFAGEWIYRVGIPAKSGVGGGIIAALPSEFGLGSFSPLLDSHGNSVRGVELCETLSSSFNLHMLTRANDVRTCIVADYDVGALRRSGRLAHEQKILDDNGTEIRILELIGTLTFVNVDYIARRILSRPRKPFIILGMGRVPIITAEAAKLLAGLVQRLAEQGVFTVLAGVQQGSTIFKQITDSLPDKSNLRNFALLDEAIEWAEDQIIFRCGGFTDVVDVALEEQALLSGLSRDAFDDFAKVCETRNYQAGERIIAARDPSDSVFFLERGMVSVKLADGVRLATLVPGTTFGELALIGLKRTADVWADNGVRCKRVSLEAFNGYRSRHPAAVERIMRNLAHLLAARLGQANSKIDLLSST